MIFPCVATHYHPYVYQRAQRLLGVDSDVPLNKRKKIVYLTRQVLLLSSATPQKLTTTTQNKSRKVVNEKELLAALEFWLKDHDRMEELYVFEHDHWPDLNDLIRFFNQGCHSFSIVALKPNADECQSALQKCWQWSGLMAEPFTTLSSVHVRPSSSSSSPRTPQVRER